MDYTDFREKFYKLVDEAKSVVITTHVDSDNDAVASLLAIYSILTQKYPDKKVAMVVVTPPDERLSYFANFEKIQLAGSLADKLAGFDLAIFVDANYAERFNLTKEQLQNFAGQTICLDHHASRPDQFTLSLIEPEAASASDVIYFTLLVDETKLAPELCEILLAGLLSDTYRFQYVLPEQARVFDMAKRLVVEGQVNIEKLQSVYEGLSQPGFTVLREFVKNAQVQDLVGWPKFLTSYVARDFVAGADLTDEQVHEGKEKFMGYLKEIIDVPWGLALYPLADGRVKVSFRATAEGPSVRKIAEGLGIGSGHDPAAGGTFVSSGQILNPQECLKQILDWLKTNRI